MHQSFREAIWLCGLAYQLYLGFALIEEIDIHADPVFTMSVCGSPMTDHCVRYITVASVFIILMYFVFMLAVTVALQVSFYWAWGAGWKHWWVGRAACCMWGPIEDEEMIWRRVENLHRFCHHQSSTWSQRHFLWSRHPPYRSSFPCPQPARHSFQSIHQPRFQGAKNRV
jgi:hypothetical protein